MDNPFEFRNLEEIISEYQSQRIPYEILLTTIEWRDFRKKILERDNFKCFRCQRKSNLIGWWLKGSISDKLPYVTLSKDEDGSIINEYSSEQVILHAHHKFYLREKYPWEYTLDALETLCSECHQNVHDTTEILIYDNIEFQNPEILKSCSKCNGSGYIPKYKYIHNGICFDCNGKGFSSL